MEKYELTIVLPGKATPAKKKSVTERIEKIVKTLKGKVADSDEWGKKELAYEIEGQDSGVFINFTLKLDGTSVKAVTDKLRLDEDIIRYLIVAAKPKKEK